MRKISILFVSALVLGMTFTSCSNDDNSPAPAPASVEGKWNFSKISETVNGVTSPEVDYDHEPGCNKDYIELKAGGVFNEVYYFGSDCASDLNTGTWSKSGNIITITLGGVVASVEVVSVSSSVLKVKFSETYEGITTVINTTFTKA
nr:lipocalin family protein [uncultured Flavobacterium sp.]